MRRFAVKRWNGSWDEVEASTWDLLSGGVLSFSTAGTLVRLLPASVWLEMRELRDGEAKPRP